MFSDLPPIPVRGRLSSAEILLGTPVPAITRLQTISEDDFEVVCLEWATGYLKTKYDKIRQFGGAGDKGRDMVGYYADGGIDIYQCKHYSSALSPSMIYSEFGKLCFYTFKRVFPIPKSYFIVTPINIGPKLQGLLENPNLINKELIDNWEKHCQKEITKTEEVLLTGDFLTYIENFDFSIVKDKSPMELIEEHGNTSFHAARFGGGLKKYRSVIPIAEKDIQNRELTYVSQLYKVYSEFHSKSIGNQEELKNASITHSSHFEEQRNGFYAAESLEVFSRENFPDANPLPFEEIKQDSLVVATNTLLLNENEKGLKKLLSVIQELHRQGFTNNALSIEIKPIDKIGICHHLVNDTLIQWIP